MRIAYVTTTDPQDPYAWSGINHKVLRLLSAEAEVVPIGPLTSLRTFFCKARAGVTRLLPGKHPRYLWSLDPGLLRSYARQVERHLEKMQPDLVFSPGTQPIAHLGARWPIVFWTDAPFGAMRGYYPWYQGVASESIRDGMACDDLALRKCRAACYSSDWAARAAVEHHGADPSKVHVLPFGANLAHDASPENLIERAAERLHAPWRFLFVGVEWERKGGDLALEVVRQLNATGHPAELIVAGCAPPARCEPLPPYVRLEGFVSQHTVEGRRRLGELFESALFYLMPSRAEAYGIVFCEASSHGVPSLSTRTGGIPTIVHDGENGQLFDPAATAGEYVDFILRHSTPGTYLALSRSSLDAYRARLDWSINQPRLAAVLAAAASAAPADDRPAPVALSSLPA